MTKFIINNKRIFYFIAIIIFLVYLSFSLYIYPWQFKHYFLLVDFRNYYSIITGITGIFIGLFYYFHRLYTDHKNTRNSIFRQRLSLLLDELNTFDSYVDKFFNKDFSNQKELDAIRNKIARSFELVEIILKENLTALDLTGKEIDSILEPNSFIDNSTYITEVVFPELIFADLSDIKDAYIEKIKDAKRVCIIKTI